MLAIITFYFFIFSFIFISWRLVTSQHFSGFCHTLTWISHGVTYIPHPDPPSHLPLHPIPLGLPKVKVKSLNRVRLFATHGLSPTRLLCPWDFPGKSTRVGCHFLLQRIFPTQGLNLGLPHCRQTLYRLSHQGSHYNFLVLFYSLPTSEWTGQGLHPFLRVLDLRHLPLPGAEWD